MLLNLLPYLLHIVIILLNSVTGSPSRDSPYARLYRSLFDDYLKYVRPTREDVGSTNIIVSPNLYNIIRVDADSETLIFSRWFQMFWLDPNLAWDPNDYNGTTELLVEADKIWIPDITIIEMLTSENAATPMDFASLNYTGEVRYSLNDIISVYCSYNVDLFPYDRQTCNVSYVSWEYPADQITVNAMPSDHGNLMFFTDGAEWRLNSYTWTNLTITDDQSISFDGVTYMIEFEERITIGLTACLAMSVVLMMVSDLMPKTDDYFPLLGQFMLWQMFITALATVIGVLIMYIQSWSMSLSHDMPNVVLTLLCIPDYEDEDDDDPRMEHEMPPIRKDTAQKSARKYKTNNDALGTYSSKRCSLNLDGTETELVDLPPNGTVLQNGCVEEPGDSGHMTSDSHTVSDSHIVRVSPQHHTYPPSSLSVNMQPVNQSVIQRPYTYLPASHLNNRFVNRLALPIIQSTMDSDGRSVIVDDDIETVILDGRYDSHHMTNLNNLNVCHRVCQSVIPPTCHITSQSNHNQSSSQSVIHPQLARVIGRIEQAIAGYRESISRSDRMARLKWQSIRVCYRLDILFNVVFNVGNTLLLFYYFRVNNFVSWFDDPNEVEFQPFGGARAELPDELRFDYGHI